MRVRCLRVELRVEIVFRGRLAQERKARTPQWMRCAVGRLERSVERAGAASARVRVRVRVRVCVCVRVRVQACAAAKMKFPLASSFFSPARPPSRSLSVRFRVRTHSVFLVFFPLVDSG